MVIFELKLLVGVGLQVWGSVVEQVCGLVVEVVGWLCLVLVEQGQVLLVVFGGCSLVVFFEVLSEELLDWLWIIFSLVDECWVLELYVDSNVGLVCCYLFCGEVVKVCFIGFYQLVVSLEEVVELVDYYLYELLLLIDVLVFGMGDDGYIVLLFLNSFGLDLVMDFQGMCCCLLMWVLSVLYQCLILLCVVLVVVKVQLLVIQGQFKLVILNVVLVVEDEWWMLVCVFFCVLLMIYWYF